jgi:hypothetical protein
MFRRRDELRCTAILVVACPLVSPTASNVTRGLFAPPDLFRPDAIPYRTAASITTIRNLQDRRRRAAGLVAANVKGKKRAGGPRLCLSLQGVRVHDGRAAHDLDRISGRVHRRA